MKNRIEWFDKKSFWHQWRSNINSKYLDVVNYFQSENKDTNVLKAILEQNYKSQDEYILKVINFLENILSKTFLISCDKIEDITKTPLYKNDFIIYLTTFPRWFYDSKEWCFGFYIDRNVNNITWNFLHELLHFQFIHYFKKKIINENFNNNDFEKLKEALTIILNKECNNILFQPDRGYPEHQLFRQELEKQWEKERDFAKLVNFWVINIHNF